MGFVYMDTFLAYALFISAILDLGDVLKLFMISFVERTATLLRDCADVADVVDFGFELLIEWVGGLLIYCLFVEGVSYFLTVAGFFGSTFFIRFPAEVTLVMAGFYFFFDSGLSLGFILNCLLIKYNCKFNLLSGKLKSHS